MLSFWTESVMGYISTTLSLATQLKDAVDIAAQIYDCFAELPRIYENSRKLVQDVRETLQEMRAIYTEDMEDSSLLNESLTTLKKELKAVYEKCTMLIPPVKLKKRDKFKVAFYLFWKREKVKELTLELRERVNITLRLFMFLSNQRIEGTVDKIKEALTVTLREPAPSNIVEFQTRDIHMMSTVSGAQLFLFAQTYTTPMTWMPETIPIEELSKAYLRRELANLHKSLQYLSVNWFENPPAEIDIPPLQLTWSLNGLPSSSIAIHKDAIMQTFTIQTLLDSPNNSWVHNVNIGLSHLASILSDLNMHEEAVSLNALRIDLYAATSTVYPNSFASDYVAAALTNLSVEFHNMGDEEHSHDTSKEAVKRIESLLLTKTANRNEMYALLARILAVEAEQHPAANIALNLVAASVYKVEVALGIKNTTPNHMPSKSVTESDFNDRITAAIERNVSYDLLFTYASMLSTLSVIQGKNELLLEASESAKQTLIILLHLSKLYPGSAKILHLASNVLGHFFSTELFTLNTIAENSQYLQANADYLMQLASVNPQRWVPGLLRALISKRYNRLLAGNVTGAREIHQQILGLGSLAVDNHTNLKIPSETEADYYCDLAKYHLLECKCVPDAIYAARNAISQYSALEFMTPGRSPVKHFNMLVFLSKALTEMKQYDSALAEGFKALQLLDRSSVQGHDLAILQDHMKLLDNMMEALDASSDSRTLERARDVNARIRKLFLTSEKRPEFMNAQAPRIYASILQKNDLLDEAALYLQDVLRTWDATYGQAANPNTIGLSYLMCLMALPTIFKSTGEIDKALYYSQEGMEVAEKYFSEGFDLLKSVCYINMSSMHMSLLCDAGRCNEALALSELAIAFARENDQANGYKQGLLQLLLSRAFCQLHLSQPQAAIASSTEAVVECRKALGPNAGRMDKKSSILDLLHISLKTISDGLAGSGDVDQALTYLQEAKDTLILQEIAAREEVGSNVTCYIVLATKKSRLFFAKGDYEEAAEIIKKGVIEKYRTHANSSAPIVSVFIRALRYAGILFCTLGRHTEGIAAASELHALKENISANSPNSARLVEVHWRRAESRGLSKCVQNAKDKLTCHHQDF